jgi:hypothetical protein
LPNLDKIRKQIAELNLQKKIKLILTSSEVKTYLEMDYYIPSAILRQNMEMNYGVKSSKNKLILTSSEINTYLKTDYYIPSAMIG